MRIEHYQSFGGRVPFEQWLDVLDKRQQTAVKQRLAAVRDCDHFGDCRSLHGGLYEMRLMGLGLRVYFANIDRAIVLLLGGSDKESQTSAIRIARVRLREFKERKM